jgi:hypothetical protein
MNKTNKTKTSALVAGCRKGTPPYYVPIQRETPVTTEIKY